MKKKLSYMITIMLAFTLSLALGLFFNSAHADSLPQKDGANQKTTKVTVSNKDVPVSYTHLTLPTICSV